MRNLFICPVHIEPACVRDLVRNLRHLDPGSDVLLYNGGAAPDLLGDPAVWGRLGAQIHPAPQPIRWGRGHSFVFDAMAYALAQGGYDALTFIDSDQLLLRAGYSAALAACLAQSPRAGMLGSCADGRPPADPLHPPTASALRELDRWRAYLRRYDGGLARFPRWTFWAGTVFPAAAARDLLALWRRDDQLRCIVAQSRMLVTEEVLLPTMADLLGYPIAAGPGSPAYIRFRRPYTLADLHAAAGRPDCYWMHPVPRQLDDPLRTMVRDLHNSYTPLDAPPPPAAIPEPADAPRASCLLVTADRRPLLPGAIAAFLRQSYPNRELVIIDDGDDPVADLVPPDPRISYRRLPGRLPVSQKRNLACAAAGGAFLLTWDDDDWHADWRVAYQVQALRTSGAEICGAGRFYAYDTRSQTVWQYLRPPGRPWVAGGSMAFTRATWERAPYPQVDPGSDTRFQLDGPPRVIVPLPDVRFIIARVHGANYTCHACTGPQWFACPADALSFANLR